jgi:O-antigen/teichoic acid export membrane protein
MFCTCLLSGLIALFLSIFNGMQKFQFSSGIQTLTLLFSSFGSLALLYNGYGIIELAEFAVLYSIVILLIAFFIFIYLLPSYRISFVTQEKVIPFFKQSIQFYVTSLCSFVVLRSDIFLIAIILGPVATGIIALPPLLPL